MKHPRQHHIISEEQYSYSRRAISRRTMSSSTARLDRYRLESKITENSVTHRTIQSDLDTRRRRIQILTTWTHQKKLGAGAFGEVTLQREVVSGKLRAVKAISKSQLRTHEMEALIELQDVWIPLLVEVGCPDKTSIAISLSSSWAGTRAWAWCISRWNISPTGTSPSILSTTLSIPGKRRRLRIRSSMGSSFSTKGRFAIVI